MFHCCCTSDIAWPQAPLPDIAWIVLLQQPGITSRLCSRHNLDRLGRLLLLDIALLLLLQQPRS